MRLSTTIAMFLISAAVVALAVRDARPADPETAKLRVVATLPDYADLARTIGGDRVSVQAIVRGDQDAHFIRPKPSFVDMAGRAQVLVTTGLDLEMWLPTVIDKSGNTHVRSGQPGYVAVAEGIPLLEKPAKLSRAEGGVHIYGNPHMTCSPVNMKTVARNIGHGLIKNDPEGKAAYQANLERLLAQIDTRLFGDKLPELLGAETLCRMAHNGTLVAFLQEHKLKGKPLADYAGGWLKRMRPLWGTPLVTYHKNWIYFIKIFDLEEAGTVEPKPGIPPTPRHVNELVTMMKGRHIRLILAANYFDEQKIRMVASRVGAEPVIVPLYVGGEPKATDYFSLVDLWIDRLLAAAERAGMLAKE